MPRASRGALALALITAVVASGCTVDATGFRITLTTHGTAIDRIDVTVLTGAESRIGSGSYTGDIADGSTFGVKLPDSLDGSVATVRVVATKGGLEVGRGSATATVVRHEAVGITLEVIGSAVDLGGQPDLAVTDLSQQPDLAVPPDGAALDGPPADLVSVDLQAPPDLVGDLAIPCVASCAGGNAVVCEGGVARQVTCSFGCNGAQCAGPDTCMQPGVINQSGAYVATTAGSMAGAGGSCQAQMGPENILSFSPQLWTKATFTLDASFPATLFARRTCADASSEWVGGGLCQPSVFSPACAAGNPKASLTLCGLPAGDRAFVFVEHAGGAGGIYTLNATYAPVSLNTCAEAGLLPGTFSVQGLDTSAGLKDLNAAPMGAPNCGDRGVGSPEMVFWLPITAANDKKTLTVTVTSQGALQPLLYIQTSCMSASTVCYQPSNGVAKGIQVVSKDLAYYIFVDGLNQTKGKFNLDVTLK